MRKLTSKQILYAIAIVLGVSTIAAAFLQPAGAWPLCILSIACVAIANLDRFSEISAGTDGVRAVIKSAEKQISEMGVIAKLQAKATLTLVQRTGRIGSLTDDEKDAFLSEIVGFLQAANVSDEEIKTLTHDAWDRYVFHDFAHAILGGSTTPDPSNAELQAERKALINLREPATPAKLRQFLAKWGLETEGRQRLVEEFEYYFANRSFHHRDVWLQRRELGRTD